MRIEKTELEKVLLIKPDVFKDHRGEYAEIYNKELYCQNGIDIKFIQDDISVSKKNVLRGIHGDNQTWKLISCLFGKFYLVVVNCDISSKDFGKWQSFILSDKNRFQVLVPPKHGNAHLVLSKLAIFHYKQSTYYNPKNQFTYKWNDSRFNISWPIKNPMLSKRDKLGHFVS
ncbi:MAG: dTDP-4-dehydrorhamnose 3,5-epimerase family protein [Candidatus Omnitrophota bacterium]